MVKETGPPDGGLRAYFVAVASFFCNGVIFGIMNSFSVIHVSLEAELSKYDKHAASKSSLVGSMAMGTTFFMSIVAGILVDKLGIRLTAFLGGAIATVGMFLSAFFVAQVEVLYITYGVFLGLGASLAYTPSLVILGHYFNKYMGLVNGIVCAGSSVFTMFMGYLMQYLIASFGLKYAFMCLSMLLSLLMVSALIFKPLHEQKPTKSPTEPKCCEKMINTENWHQKKYVIWVLTIPFTLMGYFVPYVYAVAYVKHNFPGNDGTFLVLCIGISSGIGRLVFGKIADHPRVNRIFLQQISFVLIGILTMVMTAAPNFPVLVCIVLVMGLFDGCFITLLGPIAYDFCGKAGASQAIGCLLSLCSLPITIGPPIAGLLFEKTGSYYLPFLLSGVPPIAGGILLSLVHCVKQGDSKAMVNGTAGHSDSSEREQENEALFHDKYRPIITNSLPKVANNHV